jgi:hypothetical protein
MSKYKRSSLAERRAAREKYKKAKKKPLGEGSRFKAVAASAKAGGARNPAAVAAAIGRKKYGKAKFQRLAAAGRKKS